MRIDYDTTAGALSFEVSDEPVVRTVTLDSETLVDLDAAGRVVAVEVLRPERPWPVDQILGFDDPTGLVRVFVGIYPQHLGGLQRQTAEVVSTDVPSYSILTTAASYGSYSTSSPVRSGGSSSRMLVLAS